MTATSGAVYDRGYRPFEGELGGRNATRRALFLATIRRALGIRRSWRQKVAPWTLLTITMLPAIINVGVAYLTRDSPFEDFEFITYREYVGVSSTLLVFVALTAPDVLCPERRQRVLPVIMARPLTGADYVFAKVGGIFAIVFGFSFVPHVVLFVGQMFVADGAWTYLTDNIEVVAQVPASVAILALYYALLGAVASSLTTRRIVAATTFLGVMLTASITAAVIVGENEHGAPALLNLLALPLHLRDLVFLGHLDPQSQLGTVANGGIYAVALYGVIVSGSIAWLLRRYRWIES